LHTPQSNAFKKYSVSHPLIMLSDYDKNRVLNHTSYIYGFRFMKMRFFLLLVSLFSMSLIFSGCKSDMVSKPDRPYPEISSWLAEHKSSVTYGLPGQQPDMESAFKQGYILVLGEGLPKQGVSNPGQQRLTAQRAAEVVALRNLSFVLTQGGRYGSIRFGNYSSPLKPGLQGSQVVLKAFNKESGKAAVLIEFDLEGIKNLTR